MPAPACHSSSHHGNPQRCRQLVLFHVLCILDCFTTAPPTACVIADERARAFTITRPPTYTHTYTRKHTHTLARTCNFFFASTLIKLVGMTLSPPPALPIRERHLQIVQFNIMYARSRAIPRRLPYRRSGSYRRLAFDGVRSHDARGCACAPSTYFA